jgi:hypothetical protein
MHGSEPPCLLFLSAVVGGGGCSGCGVGGAGQRWLSELAAAALELPTDEHVRSSSPAPMRHDK